MCLNISWSETGEIYKKILSNCDKYRDLSNVITFYCNNEDTGIDVWRIQIPPPSPGKDLPFIITNYVIFGVFVSEKTNPSINNMVPCHS